MILFENVSKRFKEKNALYNLTIHVERNAITGIMGVSGAGKTTFIKLATGLLSPSCGRVRTLKVEPVKNKRKLGRDIGLFTAGVPLLPINETINNSFEILKYTYGIEENQFNNDLKDLSEKLGFCKYQNEIPQNLSLGQRMRAELAAALIHRPKILILDEPSIVLDANTKETFRDILNEHHISGMGILLATNDITEAEFLCNRIILLDKGELLYYGDKKHLYSIYTPIDIMTIKLNRNLPDLGDLPLKKYVIENNVLSIHYNSNHINAVEIIRHITQLTSISEVKIRKPDLSDIIMQIQKGAQNDR